MLLNADRSQRVVIDAATAPWVASPAPGVERIKLEREDEEAGRATSIVRYAAGSAFTAHTHHGGEEFLVLEGVFHDEHGQYAAGTYVRNPRGSLHAPGSVPGCVLFVKLCQIPEDDRHRICLRDTFAQCTPYAEQLDRNQTECEFLLHQTRHERVSLLCWRAGHSAPVHVLSHREEVLVLDGDLEDEHGIYRQRTWLRQPAGHRHRAHTRGGCLLYLKRMFD